MKEDAKQYPPWTVGDLTASGKLVREEIRKKNGGSAIRQSDAKD